MRRRAVLVSAAAVALAVTFASLAFATAQPTSPAAGATTSSHPTFTWVLPANEEADWIAVSSRPETTPTGEFFTENVVDFDLLDAGEQTRWAPSKALFAGTHWWNVRTHDRNTFQSMFSPPSPFTVGAQTRIVGLRIRRNSYTFIPDDLTVDVTWATNVRAVVVDVVVMRGRRRVGRLRRAEETFSPLTSDSAFLTWRRPRSVRTGSRLTVIVSVRGGGRVASARRVVRAP